MEKGTGRISAVPNKVSNHSGVNPHVDRDKMGHGGVSKAMDGSKSVDLIMSVMGGQK